ncbi:UNVERIFIED_CONTAM: hypothetical protein PYX00_008069 [Menopon gallinae]|uniref:MD-2-related lipid-recognition domain-containing protein n=1 Tax=Menopon gallinae TaxID=328185 RepID=A0AAW2HMG2_9NEOP
MQKFLIFLVLGLTCVYGKEYTPVKQCGSEKLFKNVAINTSKGLCRALPCQLKLGETITAEIEFENKELVEKIVSKCKAVVLGSELDFPIPNAEKGCDQLIKGKCPAAPKSDLALKLTVPVKPPSLAKLGVDAKMEISLLDQNKKVISCFMLTAKVNV